jgi:haloalkane dehalogenase
MISELIKMCPSRPAHGKDYRDLFPFAPHFMDIQGFRCHYIDEGHGEPVVMVHGNPTWSFYYRRLISALSPSRRAIALDHIGCGLSEKPPCDRFDYTLSRRVSDFTYFVEKLHLQDTITLVAHDWGGMIAMAWAVRHPERVRRLILFNTAAFMPPGGKPIPVRLRLIRNLKCLSTPLVLGANLFARSALFMAAQKPLPPQVRSGLVAPYDSWHNRIATLRFVFDIPLGRADAAYRLVRWVESRLDTLGHVPMLICWGAHDFVFDRDYFNEWQRRFPKAEAHYFPNAGHYVLEDEADRIIELVTDFLERPR